MRSNEKLNLWMNNNLKQIISPDEKKSKREAKFIADCKFGIFVNKPLETVEN